MTQTLPQSNADRRIGGICSDLASDMEWNQAHPEQVDTPVTNNGATALIIGTLNRASAEIEQLEEIETLARQLLREAWIFDKSEPCGSVARMLDWLLSQRTDA